MLIWLRSINDVGCFKSRLVMDHEVDCSICLLDDVLLEVLEALALLAL